MNEKLEEVEEVGAPASVVEAVEEAALKPKPRARRKRKRKPAAPKPETEEAVEADPLTTEEFRTRVTSLLDHARAAGLQPLKIMGAAYARRAFAALDGFLSGLAGDDERKPPKE